MSLIIFKDELDDDLAIDPTRIVMVGTSIDGATSEITLQLGYRGEIATYKVKHTVVEIVDAINKVDKFGF